MGGAVEIIQNPPPLGFFARAAAMAFIHHNQIKESRLELAEWLVAFIARQLLIEAHINFVSAIERFIFHLGNHIFERAEIVLHGLVNQNIAVGEIENALFQFVFHQPPDDLKGGVGFARTGRHDQ